MAGQREIKGQEMAIELGNEDRPWAAQPVWLEEPEELVVMPEGLWSAALRELDPQPVDMMVAKLRFFLTQIDSGLTAVEWDGVSVKILRETVEKAVAATRPEFAKTTVEVPRKLLEPLIEYMGEGLDGCDHQVGICMCESMALYAELKLALDGKLTCRSCGGDQYTWDEGVFLEKTAEIAAVTGEDLDELRSNGQDYGNVKCPECSGAGVVRIKVSA